MNPPETVTEMLEVCGLDGDSQAPPSRGELNHFIRRVLIHHVRPLKSDVKDTKHSIQNIQEDYSAIKNQIKGAKWALYMIAGVVAFLIPLMLKIVAAIELLSK